MKYSLSLTTAIIILAALCLAPFTLLHAQTIETQDDTSLFGSLRERQISNRQKIKANLRELITSEQVHETEHSVDDVDTQTIDDPIVVFAYRLQSIADRLESHILLAEYNGTTLPNEVELSFVDAQMQLITVLEGLAQESLSEQEAIAILQDVREKLHFTIKLLKDLPVEEQA